MSPAAWEKAVLYRAGQLGGGNLSETRFHLWKLVAPVGVGLISMVFHRAISAYVDFEWWLIISRKDLPAAHRWAVRDKLSVVA